MEIPSSGWKILINSQFLDQPSTSGVSFSKLPIDFSIGFSLSNVEYLHVAEKHVLGMSERFQNKNEMKIPRIFTTFSGFL